MSRMHIVIGAVLVAIPLNGCGGHGTVSSTVTKTVTQSPVTTTVTQPAQTVTVTTTPTACVQNGVSVRGWNTDEDNTSENTDRRSGTMPLGNVNGVSFDSGACFDEMVVQTDTREAVGFDAKYVDKSEITGIASGHPVNIEGNAYLKLVVTVAPEEPDHSINDLMFSPHGNSFPTIQDAKFLGYQEGHFAFAVGVSERLPFAATRIVNPDRTVAIVLRVAHH